MSTSSTQTPDAANPSPQRTFLGHPVGLYVLFFTEMWERFSYYGMRALLMTYMLNYMKWSQGDASKIFKAYTSFVYVTPIIGGYLADRYLGNKRTVIIGAVLMAVGHFLMAFDNYQIFMSALVFLILGNGFFKPNMSTQVGRLYPPGDGRRDGAYTIFYMGINLGAFMSPLVCGWLQENTVGGYHSGFTMAGIGMVIGLVIYLVGQPMVKEIAGNGPAAASTSQATAVGGALSEAEAEREPTRLGPLYSAAPALLFIAGGAVLLGVGGIAAYAAWSQNELLDMAGMVLLTIGGGCLFLMGYVCREVTDGVRDRVLAILALGVFVIFFWAAFEQAGNVLNVWADKFTNRYITEAAVEPSVVPVVVQDAPRAEGTEQVAEPDGVLHRFRTMFHLKPQLAPAADAPTGWIAWLTSSFNPMPTAWFQSINALGIFVIAPFFAWMWLALDRRGWQPSIPMKMVMGLLLMSGSMAIMTAAAERENKPTSVAYDANVLPPGLETDVAGRVGRKVGAKGKFEPFQAGRLKFDPTSKSLLIHGVLSDNERDDIIEATAPAAFKATVDKLAAESKKIDGDEVTSVSITVDEVPPGFDMKFSGLKTSAVEWQPAENKLIAYTELKQMETKGLLAAAGEPAFRALAGEIFLLTSKLLVSPWWLFWMYVLATLGELCLSPVGLSMVSKLAPAKFATMLMGVWLLTSAFGGFAAGALGELWGTIPPIQFFTLLVVVAGGAALVLLVLVRVIVSAMHGVK